MAAKPTTTRRKKKTACAAPKTPSVFDTGERFLAQGRSNLVRGGPFSARQRTYQFYALGRSRLARCCRPPILTARGTEGGHGVLAVVCSLAVTASMKSATREVWVPPRISIALLAVRPLGFRSSS